MKFDIVDCSVGILFGLPFRMSELRIISEYMDHFLCQTNLILLIVFCGFLGQQKLEKAPVGMDLVIIPAGVPRRTGMKRDDLFKMSAGTTEPFVKELPHVARKT